MTNYLLTKLVRNCLETSKFVLRVKNNCFGETRKCPVSQGTAILFKDSKGDSGKRDCPEKSSPPSRVSDNSCSSESSMKNECDNVPWATKDRCKEISSISEKNSCHSDSRKFEMGKLNSESPVIDDPCPSRDCKLSSTVRCSDSPPGQKPCPAPRCPLFPPPEGFDEKRRFWKNLTRFLGVPAVIILSIIMHTKEKSKEPRPKYVPMDYMYRRTKPFPWGDGNHTLFHNPEKNPVPPHGYEVDDPNEVKKNN